MKTIEQHLKEKYHLSSYQIAQLTFLGKTFFSETIKILIMGIIFQKYFLLYSFALFIMIILRCSTGGLHFYTYLSCLFTSTIYIWLAIILLPKILIPLNLKIVLLLISILAVTILAPFHLNTDPHSVTILSEDAKKRFLILFLYKLILYIMPKSTYLTVGFWIIILHSLQLMTAKYTRKE